MASNFRIRKELGTLREQRKSMSDAQCNASAIQQGKRINALDAVRRRMEGALGTGCKYHQTNYFYAGRSNFYCAEHLFSSGNNQVRVFEKCHANPLATTVDETLNRFQSQHFKTPFCFGSIKAGPYTCSLWEWIDVRPLTRQNVDLPDLIALIRAIAEFNGASTDIVRSASVPKQEIRPRKLVQDHIDQMIAVEADENNRALAVACMAKFAGVEHVIQQRLLRLPQVVCHNDVHFGNLLRKDAERLYITDWDSTSLNPLGFDLNILCVVPEQFKDAALSYYMDELRERDIHVNVADIAFSFTCSYFYKLLRGHLLRPTSVRLSTLCKTADQIVGML